MNLKKELKTKVRKAPPHWLCLWTTLLEFLKSFQKAAKRRQTYQRAHIQPLELNLEI